MTEGYIEKSMAVEQSDLEKINRFTQREFTADKLYIFSVVLCNNDIDRDFESFSVDALNQMAEGFVGKTGICDHSMKSSDQKSRIFDAWVEKVDNEKTSDGRELYQLKAKAYMVRSEENMALITDIEAGIKKEVSISCQMGKCICSICGKDKRNGLCEHISGREYNGKMAYSILDDVRDTYEFSFVAVPAQKGAGVTKAFELEKETDMTEIYEAIKSCGSQLTLSKAEAKKLAAEIDKLNEDAELGRQYKKKLCEEVVSLCASNMPEMDIKTFGGVAQVMTTAELLSFKKAFVKMRASKDISLQLKPANTKGISNDQFKM